MALTIGVAASLCGQTDSGPAVLAEGGLSVGGNASAGPSTTDTGWLAGVTFVSAPLRMGRNWDFSVAGRLAREPVVAMARVGGDIAPAYFAAFRASASLRFVHTSGPFDVAIVGRYAETRMDSSQRLPAAENDNGNWTFLFEATAHLRWYSSRDAGAPPARRHLMPLLDVYGGVKHDRRFHRTGDLEPYDDPTGRAIAGVFIAAWRWTDSAGAPRLVVGGGADLETALRTGVRLPSAARALVRVDVDLRRRAARRP